jgi:hypothetical protein
VDNGFRTSGRCARPPRSSDQVLLRKVLVGFDANQQNTFSAAGAVGVVQSCGELCKGDQAVQNCTGLLFC